MREFNTAVNAAVENEQGEPEVWEFKVDGRPCTAHRPTPAQVALVMTAMGRHRSEAAKIAGIIDFCFGVFDKSTVSWLEERLLDPEDGFELEQLQDIIEWLIEEWSGNPTPALSVSTSSQQSTGPLLMPTT